MHDFRQDFWATVHDHFCVHIRMENESDINQYNPTVNYPMIDGMLVQLDVVRGMCSITVAINIRLRCFIS